ncbi:MAG: NUDIX hydrolase [Candidatus Micrarchaeaceae archaeon]
MRTVHKNRMFKVKEITVNMRGRKEKAYGIYKPDTVAVLPITSSGKILLEEQYRPPLGKKIYEIPAGHLERGESPADAAKRELEEETGFRTSKLRYMTVSYQAPGILCCKEYIYLAEKLGKGKQSLDMDEEITVREVSIAKVMRMIETGKITDSKTILSMLYYKRFFAKG